MFSDIFSMTVKEKLFSYLQTISPVEIEEKLRHLILIDILGFRISMKQTFGHICEEVSRFGHLS